MKISIRSYRELHRSDVHRLLPERKRDTHKGDYGKVLLLCGSTGFTGAAKLAARAAMRTGSGLVYLGVPKEVYPIVAAGLNEPVVFPLPCDSEGRFSEEAIPLIRERLSGMDAVLAGPGLGLSDAIRKLIFMLLRDCRVPLILDADGINALQGHIDVLQSAACPVVLTPHSGEFSRLCGKPIEDRYADTIRLAQMTGCTVLHKGHRTLTTDGWTVWRNRTGNPGMAKGGCGDVLSGVIVSLLGQGISPLNAAALGAYIHGAAGDCAANACGEYAMLPDDMIEMIPQILK